jgi:hypothetical protein
VKKFNIPAKVRGFYGEEFMPLILFMKSCTLGRVAGRIAAIFAGATSLAGCISSTTPILGDAKAILGERIEMHMFAPRLDSSTPGENGLRHQGVASMQWTGGRYVARNRADLVTDFTVHAFEGRDLIVQTAPRAPRPVEYALARRLADGTYMVLPIDEDTTDEETRAKFCTKTQEASCRITTPEQLFVFARALADNAEGRMDAGIVVIVPGAAR